MAWNESKITYEVCFKENQKIKYLKRKITHRKTLFQETPRGIYHRLSSLTTFNDRNRDKTDKTYPTHTEALVLAGVMKRNEFPALSKCLINETPELNDSLNNNIDEKFNYNDNRTSCLTI